jgi:hypothetical protein
MAEAAMVTVAETAMATETATGDSNNNNDYTDANNNALTTATSIDNSDKDDTPGTVQHCMENMELQVKFHV